MSDRENRVFILGAESDGGGSCPVVVAQLSTGKVWQIPRRPGGGYWGVLAVSQEYILVSETNSPEIDPGDSQNIRRLLRFKTSELDALATGW